MPPLRGDRRNAVLKRLDFIEVGLADLEECRDLTYERYCDDRPARRNVEHCIEQIVNAALDIAKLILAAEKIEIPETGRELVERLGTAGPVDENLARQMAGYVRMRNLITHNYLHLRWKLVKEFLATGCGHVAAFAQSVREFAARSEQEI